MRVIVTGGSGFIGSVLIDRLISLNYNCLNLDISKPRNLAHSSYFFNCNILDGKLLCDVFQDFKPDYVYHLAARTDLDGSSMDDYSCNTNGTFNIIQACKCFSPRKLLFTSTQLVCPVAFAPSNEYDVCPPNFYGRSKLLAESYLRLFASDFAWTIARPTTVWGPWFGLMYQGLFRTILSGRYRHVSGVKLIKRWAYVENAVHSLIRMAESISTNRSTFYVADQEPYVLSDFADSICRLSGSPTIGALPLPALRALARFGDLLQSFNIDFPLHSYRLSNILSNMEINPDFLPPSLITDVVPRDTAILRTLDWMMDYNSAFSASN
jgi:nucleoside-diphosphate-sugar epimerase